VKRGDGVDPEFQASDWDIRKAVEGEAKSFRAQGLVGIGGKKSRNPVTA